MSKYIVLGVLFTLLIASTNAGVPAEMAELAKELHNECVSQVGVDEALIVMVNDRKGFPGDEKLKCYIKCLMTELAVIDDDGEVDVEAFVGLMPDSIKAQCEKTMTACGTKKGADVCDTVYLTHKCYYETDPTYNKKNEYQSTTMSSNSMLSIDYRTSIQHQEVIIITIALIDGIAVLYTESYLQ